MPAKYRFFILLIIFSFGYANAQYNSLARFKQEQLEKESAVTSESIKKKKGIGNFLLSLYQGHISAIIAADCLYVPSCSRYSRQAINNYGLVKGVLLTADRLTRCAAFCGKDIPDRNFNEDGLATDNP